MKVRSLVAALAATLLAACRGDSPITEPTAPKERSVVTAVGTDPVSGATISTSQDDYSPGDIIHVTGSRWAPNETVRLVMTEEPDTHPDVTQDVQADSTGAFSVHFYDVQTHDLGVTFTLTATGLTSGSKAAAIFTDGSTTLTIVSISPATPSPSSSFDADISVVIAGSSSGRTWKGTAWWIDAGSATCVNTADIVDVNDTYPLTISGLAAPSSVGAHTLHMATYEDDGCTTRTGGIKDFAFSVATSNTAPALASIGNKSVDEGGSLGITATATDSDTPAQTLTFSLVGAPAAATINATSGVFSWTPTDGPAQTATFTVKVTDSGTPTMSDEEQIIVTVNNVAPTATFNAPTSVSAGSNIALSLTSPSDVSTVDAAAGFQYAFDCGAGSGYSVYSATNNASCPTSAPGSRTVKGKIKDKDGGESEYTKSVAIDNVPPTANAGDPYSGNEGSGINLAGSGSDPDGGSVTYEWTVSPNDGKCGFADVNSASTTVTCNDNGSWTLTLKVTDDESAFTTNNATVTVSNVAPTIGSYSLGANVNEGSSVAFAVGNVTDPSSADQLTGFTYAFACDGVNFGSFGASNSVNCPVGDGPGSVTIAGKAMDKDGGVSAAVSSTFTVLNVAPTATFNAPVSVNEGSPIGLSLTSALDPSTADVAAGFQYAFDCGSGYGAFSSTPSASCPTSDNGTRNVKGKIRDKDGAYTEYTGSVTVNNVAPEITLPLNIPVNPIPAGTPVTLTWNFTDQGSADTWICKISWDQPVFFDPLFASTGQSCSATKTLAAGIYTVTVYVQDDDGGSDEETATTYIVVYDPNGGFVTGGGWINSPAGAYLADLYLTGKATFGFVSKYQKGTTTPTGNTEFQFQAGSLNFKSTSYQWLVVSGARAQYKGEGTINGSGRYGFLLTGVDGQVTGGGGVDKFRIKVWDYATGTVVYDNGLAAAEDSDASTPLGGGSIVIHTK